jgi:hypothetical protein
LVFLDLLEATISDLLQGEFAALIIRLPAHICTSICLVFYR